jgi:hypothetical protein
MVALVQKNSGLAQDAVLVATAVCGIAVKDEGPFERNYLQTSVLTSDLLNRVAPKIERQLRRDVRPRAAQELKDAECEILEALQWTLPQTDTYTCSTAILVRVLCLALAKGNEPDSIAIAWYWFHVAWDHAVRKCESAIIAGHPSGYATAYHIVRDSLEDAEMIADAAHAFLELDAPREGFSPLLRQAAPEPVERCSSRNSSSKIS